MRFDESPDGARIAALRGHVNAAAMARSAPVRAAVERFGAQAETEPVSVLAIGDGTESDGAGPGELVGGVAGTVTGTGWLDIDALWSRDPALDLGRHLLERITEQARRRGLDGMLVRVRDEAAVRLFKAAGFRPSGAVADRPTGTTEITLVLRLGRDERARDDGALHPPKRETFDPVAMTNTDSQGRVRPVDQFRELPFGLYMDRGADHPSFHRLESWLLPALNVRVSRFHFNPGFERDQLAYVDIAKVWRDGDRWHTEDWYLDLIEHPGRPVELLDVDELLAAQAAGLIEPADAEQAIRVAAQVAGSITFHGHSVDTWLGAHDFPIDWS